MLATNRPTSKLAGLLLGVGLGASLDGIVLHQIAQWHNMASALVPPITIEAMQRNMTWDGMFHAAAWALIIIGVFRLHGDARKSRRGELLPDRKTFTGLLVLGWGLFNLVEGIVDHHLLGLHHVRDMPLHVPVYDWLFLGIGGIGFIFLGWAMVRRPLGSPGYNRLNRSGELSVCSPIE